MARSTNTQFAVAVHVLTYLAGMGPTHPVSSDDLSMSANVNPVYVRRVLAPLRRYGLVASRPGPHGGWVIRRRPEDISLAEVWRVVQGDGAILGIHGPDPQCPVGRRVQHSLSDIDRGLSAALEAELARRTIEDLLTAAMRRDRARRTKA